MDQRRRRQRRWADVVQMLYKCFVFTGTAGGIGNTTAISAVASRIGPALDYCRTSVSDVGPTFSRCLTRTSCLLFDGYCLVETHIRGIYCSNAGPTPAKLLLAQNQGNNPENTNRVYNICTTLDQHCKNVIQMFWVYSELGHILPFAFAGYCLSWCICITRPNKETQFIKSIYVGLMLVNRFRRWTYIKPTKVQCLLGMYPWCDELQYAA